MHKPLIIALGLLLFPTVTFGAYAPQNTSYDVLAALQTQFEGPELAIAYQIVQCESSGNPNARHLNENGTTDWNYFQVNDIHEKEAKRLGLDFRNSELDNVRMARIIYERQSWSAWLLCSAKIGI